MKLRVALTGTVILSIFAVTELRAQQEQPSGTQDVVRLTDLLTEAERVHPAIKAEAQMVESKRARIPQEIGRAHV